MSSSRRARRRRRHARHGKPFYLGVPGKGLQADRVIFDEIPASVPFPDGLTEVFESFGSAMSQFAKVRVNSEWTKSLTRGHLK